MKAIVEHPDRMTEELEQSIFRARAGQAGLFDNLDILTTYPETESLGGIQYTEPF